MAIAHRLEKGGLNFKKIPGDFSNDDKMALTALVPVASGSEEIEFSAIFDVLVRAGFHVTVAAPSAPGNLKLSRGLAIHVDKSLDAIKDDHFAVVAVPGGMPGAELLGESAALAGILKNAKWVGAICAAPAKVLAPLGFLEGKNFTCYPGFEDSVVGGTYLAEPVVVSGNVITADGPAHAVDFALAIVEAVKGEAQAKNVGDGLLFKK